MEHLPPDFFYYIAIGFAAQLVDGSLGMVHGVVATSLLMGLGVPPGSPRVGALVGARRVRTLLESTGVL